MATIIKGDEYKLPITIKRGSTVLTPSNVQDVRIQVADVLKEYSKNEITFNSTTNKWEYPISQSLLNKCTALTPIQVGIKVNNEIRYAPKQLINVESNIIQKEW